MASKLLVTEKVIPKSGTSTADVMLADIWALGMTVFTKLEPCLKCPYIFDIRSEGVSSQEEFKRFIIFLLQKEKLPSRDIKYDINQATVWWKFTGAAPILTGKNAYPWKRQP